MRHLYYTREKLKALLVDYAGLSFKELRGLSFLDMITKYKQTVVEIVVAEMMKDSEED